MNAKTDLDRFRQTLRLLRVVKPTHGVNRIEARWTARLAEACEQKAARAKTATEKRRVAKWRREVEVVGTKRRANTEHLSFLGDDSKALDDERAALVTYGKPYIDARWTLRRNVEDLALDLASRLPVRPGTFEGVAHEEWSNTYETQGHGANHYMVRAAAIRASFFRSLGLEVREVRKEYAVEVVVCVEDEEALEIAKRKRPLLTDWVAACWKSGINPRVLNPYLPHGFEERHGITFFGDRYDVKEAQPKGESR